MKCFILLLLVFVVAAHPAFPQNWHAIVENPGQADTEVPFCSVFQNGAVKISAGIGNDHWTRFRLDDTFYVGNNFALEARLRNTASDGGIRGFDTGMYLEGCGTDAGGTFMGELQAQEFTSIYAGRQGAFNRPQLVLDLSDWVVLTFVFRDNVFYALRNGTVFFTLPYTGELNFIHQLLVRFKGAGMLDYLKLYDKNGTIIWQEDFNSCNALAAPPDWKSAFASTVSNDTVVCKGEALRLSANMYPGSTYQWTGPNGFSSNQQNILLNAVNPKDTGFYYLTMDYKGCVLQRDSVRVGLQAFEMPAAAFLGKDTTLCLGDSLVLGKYFPCARYSWQNGSNAPTFTVNKAGIYTVTIEIENQIFTDSIRIAYHPLPQIDLGKDTALCPGETLALNAFLPTAVSYQWQDSTTNADFTVQTPGLYKVAITDVCRNTVEDSIEVTYYKVLKTLDLGRDTTLCPGASLVLDAFDEAAISYRWQDESENITFTASTAGIYAVTLSDQCNNTASDSIKIQYFELVKPVDLGSDTTLCPGETLTLRATDKAAVRYRWQDGSSNSIFTVTTAGLYSVTISDACGNQFQDAIQVNYHKVLDSLTLGRDTILCPGQTLLLNAYDSAAVIYRWQDGSRDPTFVVDRLGSYIIYKADNCGNTFTDIINVAYYEVITAVNLGKDTTLCPGETLLLNATNRAARFYRWQDASTNDTFTVRQPGIYSVQVTDYCGNTLQDMIEVKYFDVLKPVDLGKDTSLCPGSFITLDAFDAAAITYHWQDGSTATDFKVEAPGVYTVTLTDNCSNRLSDSIEVSYYQLIKSVNIGPRDTVLCVGETIQLDASSEAAKDYLWQDGATTATYRVSNPGIYQIQVNDYCGNNASDEIRIRYNDIPTAIAIGNDTVVCEGAVFRLNAQAPNASFYRWQDGLQEATYPVTEPGIYTVTVGNECGENTYAIHIAMEYCGPCRSFVPNAFSPNGDGNNDGFAVQSECLFTHYDLRVFNRWGVQVFGTIAPWVTWDGTLNGTNLPPGVYIWQLRYKAEDGSEKTMSGDVLLLR